MADASKFSPDNGATIYDLKDTNGRIMSEELTRDTVGWTGKNLLSFSLSNLKNLNTTGSWSNNVYTENGTTFTVNSDNSVTIGGSAPSANTMFTFYDTRNKGLELFKNKTLILSKGGSETLVANTDFWLNGYNNNTYVKTVGNAAGKLRLESPAFVVDYVGYNGIRIAFTINSGVSTGFTIKPMLRLATISDNTYEPYHDTVEDEITNVYKVMGVNGAENRLMNIPTYNTSQYGCSLSVVNNVFTTSGTAEGGNFNKSPIWAAIATEDFKQIFTEGGLYKLVMIGDTYDVNTLNVSMSYYDNNNVLKSILANGVGISIPSGSTFNTLTVYCKNGNTLKSTTFRLMLVHAYDTSTIYQPYAMTNRELTENKADNSDITDVYKVMGEMGAINLAYLDNTFPQTIHGMTFTANSDDSISLSGTPTEYTDLHTHKAMINPSLKYKLSGLLNTTNTAWGPLAITDSSGNVLGEIPTTNDKLDQLLDFSSYPTAKYVGIMIKRRANNVACTGTAYIKLTIESLPYDTPYQPYAMTNKELTGLFNTVDITSQVTIKDTLTAYEVSTDAWTALKVYKSNNVVTGRFGVKSLTEDGYPAGRSFANVFNNLPKALFDDVRIVVFSPTSGKNPIQIQIASSSTSSSINIRGGSIGDTVYVAFTYVCG